MSEIKTLSSYIESFSASLKQNGKATATILAYAADLRQLFDFLGKRQVIEPKAVTAELIEAFKEFLAENNYEDKSIARKLNAIKVFLNYLVEKNTLKQSPANTVRQPQYQVEPPRILSQLEYRALRDAAREDPKMSAIIEIFLQTGLRVGELTRLQLDDVLDEGKSLRIHQYESHPERIVPANAAATKAINAYLNVRPESKSKNLFVTRYGRPLLVRNLRVSINRCFRIAGIKGATINALRHTFITHQLMSGASVSVLQKLVGHKRLSTTEKYLDLVKDKIDSKVKLEEL